MVKRIGTTKRKTRHELGKPIRSRGKISLTRYLQSFKPGDRVQLSAEPGIQKGMYFMRFHGKSGVIKARKGSCYEVYIENRGKDKTLIVHPIHLKRAK